MCKSENGSPIEKKKKKKKEEEKCWKSFGNCSSLTYIGYGCPPKSTENPATKYCIDLEHIAPFECGAFIYCKSLESIKLYDQFIHQDTFFYV